MHIHFKEPILVVGAHPDDVELMAGGLISRAISEGADVYSMILSDGCENGEVEIRQKEVLKAADILGITEVRLCGIKDGCVPHNIETVKLIENYIADVKPSIVITHSDLDTHQDHKNVSYATLSATRYKPNLVFMGETPSSFFNDNLVYFDITKDFKMKLSALKVYTSQIKDGTVKIQNVKGLASFRGQKIGSKYAEAYKNWRMIF